MYGVTRILFLHTVFSFLTPPYDVLSWEVPENMFKYDEKVINCAQVGCHSFRSYSYIPRYTIMRKEVFIYLEIYYYGVLVQGVRFPDGCDFIPFKLSSPGADSDSARTQIMALA